MVVVLLEVVFVFLEVVIVVLRKVVLEVVLEVVVEVVLVVLQAIVGVVQGVTLRVLPELTVRAVLGLSSFAAFLVAERNIFSIRFIKKFDRYINSPDLGLVVVLACQFR